LLAAVVVGIAGASSCGDRSAGSAASSSAPATSSAAPPTPAPAIVRRWEPQTRVEIGSFVGDAEEDFAGVLLRSDGKREIFVVDGSTGKVAWSRTIEATTAEGRALPFTRVQSWVVWANDGAREVHLLDGATGADVRVVPLEERTVTRMCPLGSGTTLMLPQPNGYDALIGLDDGREHNNSGLRRGPACTWAPPDRDVPKWVRDRFPSDLVIGDEPAYAYEPGRVVGRSKEGRPDPILLGLGPAGNPLWQTRLGAENPTALRVVDVRPTAGAFAVLADGAYDESFVIGVDIASGKLLSSQRMLCHARWIRATETRVYAASEDQRLHVLRSDGTVLGVYGDPGGKCPRAARAIAPATSSSP